MSFQTHSTANLSPPTILKKLKYFSEKLFFVRFEKPHYLVAFYRTFEKFLGIKNFIFRLFTFVIVLKQTRTLSIGENVWKRRSILEFWMNDFPSILPIRVENQKYIIINKNNENKRRSRTVTFSIKGCKNYRSNIHQITSKKKPNIDKKASIEIFSEDFKLLALEKYEF